MQRGKDGANELCDLERNQYSTYTGCRGANLNAYFLEYVTSLPNPEG